MATAKVDRLGAARVLAAMACAVVLSVGGCAGIEAGPDEGDSAQDDFEHLVIDTLDPQSFRPLEIGPGGPGGFDGVSVDDPCDCTTNECLQDWATGQLGCDFCVTLICAGGSQHVCHACDPMVPKFDDGRPDLPL